jgi:hypothetical protein
LRERGHADGDEAESEREESEYEPKGLKGQKYDRGVQREDLIFAPIRALRFGQESKDPSDCLGDDAAQPNARDAGQEKRAYRGVEDE